MTTPKESLLAGSRIIAVVLGPAGFVFNFRGEGLGSGGKYAWGEFIRGERRLELYFRRSLGLVSYCLGSLHTAHERYMRELGVSENCCYPGFSEDPMDGFRALAHDLGFAKDFTTGSADVLRRAAAEEQADEERRNARDAARYAGDARTLQTIRDRFREKRYKDVVELSASLTYPQQIEPSQRRLIEIARKRSRNQAF